LASNDAALQLYVDYNYPPWDLCGTYLSAYPDLRWITPVTHGWPSLMGFFVVLWLTTRPFLFTSKAQRPPVGSVSTGGLGVKILICGASVTLPPVVPLGGRAWGRSAVHRVKGRQEC
jgi:hypothetical protein